MKKLTLVIALLAVLLISFVAFSAFKSKSLPTAEETSMATTDPDQTCPSSCSCVLSDECCPIGSGCTTSSGCSSDWKIPNFTWGATATTVSFSSLDVCYKPSSTPPWSSSNLIGNLTPGWGTRPSATRVFNATASNGATFQCIVYTNGNFYIQQTAGPIPGKGASLSGSYAL